ncbi:MAG: 50S ribosomal protein L21 [Candidatus Omnitrophota bacterium]|jgi:large subunit ribosomal protein L21|nr:MAG: 50S ribosomal protein L21 [Candidatus Omnitrophota bacterium]
MYAIIRTGGKQYQVSPGDILEVETVSGEKGTEIILDDILLVNDGETIRVGTPQIENAMVKADILAHGRGRKIIVFKFKRRKQYRRKQGHRQDFSRIRIKEIILSGDQQLNEPVGENPIAEAN